MVIACSPWSGCVRTGEAVEQVSSIFYQETVDLLLEGERGIQTTTPELVSAVVRRSKQSGRTVGFVLVRGSGW